MIPAMRRTRTVTALFAMILWSLSVMGPGSAGASFIYTDREDAGGVSGSERKQVGADREREVAGERLAQGRERPPDPVGQKNFQALTHLLGSHAAMVVRPVTSAHRLIDFVMDTGAEILGQRWIAGFPAGRPGPLSKGPEMDLELWETELDRITGSVSSWGSIRYLIDGDRFFPRLTREIQAAERSVDMRTYIFDNDDLAVRIGKLLKDRSEDIDVRVMLDGLGTILSTKEHSDSLPADHEAPDSVRSFLQTDSRIKLRQQTNPWLTGDHTKATIIDGRMAFVGGMNIGREYRSEWHDVMMELRGPVVTEIQEDFDEAWVHAGTLGDLGSLLRSLGLKRGKGEEPGVNMYPVRILRTRTGKSEIYRAQLEAIKRARRRIYIENPYFSSDAILYELVRARYRGVDVRVILPQDGNHITVHKSNVTAINAMLEHGIRVYLYPGMTHVKAAVYDGWACLGSANLDKLSLKVNREMNVATSHPEAVKELVSRLFLTDMARSSEVQEPQVEGVGHFFAEILADHL